LVLKEADLVIPDGVGIKIALKVKGINQENIPGIEFAKKLISVCRVEGYAIGLLGAKEEIIQKTCLNLREEFPSLNITYVRNGYFSESEENIIIEEIKSMSPKVLFVALGAPKQEFFIAKARKKLPNTIFIGVGGSFDVWSGNVKRAPAVYQKLGLEWLYRTLKEPSRFKRIFPALPLFLIRVIIEAGREKLIRI
jgi:N-acetylglucosaminyldiphosphoundecaprenol N-acetyl-beta-D-mannosaminyltransferase